MGTPGTLGARWLAAAHSSPRPLLHDYLADLLLGNSEGNNLRLNLLEEVQKPTVSCSTTLHWLYNNLEKAKPEAA